jgi:hypothetical protein
VLGKSGHTLACFRIELELGVCILEGRYEGFEIWDGGLLSNGRNTKHTRKHIVLTQILLVDPFFLDVPEFWIRLVQLVELAQEANVAFANRLSEPTAILENLPISKPFGDLCLGPRGCDRLLVDSLLKMVRGRCCFEEVMALMARTDRGLARGSEEKQDNGRHE